MGIGRGKESEDKMYTKMSVHFSRRNMLIKKNAQNVILQDGKRTMVKVKKFFGRF